MNKPVIICVDDEQIILNSLKKQLERHFGDSFSYEFTESADEAMEVITDLVAEGRQVVMVISDQIMPGITGDQLLINVHATHPQSVKILLTGQAALESAVNAINNANLYRYLTKPWEEKDFLLTVEKGVQKFFLQQEVKRQIEVFQKFVPKALLEHLGKQNILDIELGNQVQSEMSILFSDIRGFTTISEQLSPKANFDFINSYLAAIGPIIPAHHGFICNYMGDGIMALFPNAPDDAVTAAVEMQRTLATINKERAARKEQPINIGIGIHTGPVMLGTIGDTERMQATVIADAVNLASRLEGLTKYYGITTAVSGETIARLSGHTHFHCRGIGQVRVKGKSSLVQVYDVYDGEPETAVTLKEQTKADFETALGHYYARRFSEACTLFTSVLQRNPLDKVARLYLERSSGYLVNDVPKDWTGLEFKKS